MHLRYGWAAMHARFYGLSIDIMVKKMEWEGEGGKAAWRHREMVGHGSLRVRTYPNGQHAGHGQEAPTRGRRRR